MTLQKTYNILKKSIDGIPLEPFSVISTVEAYRQYWKPRKIKTILLAESHVKTTAVEHRSLLNAEMLRLLGLADYPRNFCRFIYCLGKGENDLLSRAVPKNASANQFWEILYSCCNKIRSKDDFKPILKSGERSLEQRLRNKVNVLREFKKNGVWLMDASIVRLYPMGDLDLRKRKHIINLCWESHNEPIIASLKPRRVICIGKEIYDILGEKLKQYCDVKWVYQPQAHLISSQRIDNFRKLGRLVEK